MIIAAFLATGMHLAKLGFVEEGKAISTVR